MTTPNTVVADGKLTIEQRGLLAIKQDEITRRANEKTLPFDPLLGNLQAVIEGRFVQSPTSPLLIPQGLATARAFSERSTVGKLIRVDTSEDALMAIGYVDPVIGKWFGKLPVELSADTALAYHKLARQSRDFWILGALEDGKEETTWGEIFSLMRAQPRGPHSSAGPLLTSGYANIFFVRDHDDELRAVRVFWNAGDRGWYVLAYSVADRLGWSAGDLVFSRN